MAPSPVCQWTFPHTSLILQLYLPCTAPIPALSTSLATEHCSTGLLQLSAALSTELPVENLFPARLQWISSFAGVCREERATQWPPHCLSGPLALPCGEGAALPLHHAGQGCCLHQWCTAEHPCCHCTGGLGCIQKLPQQSQKTPTLYIENSQMIY